MVDAKSGKTRRITATAFATTAPCLGITHRPVTLSAGIRAIAGVGYLQNDLGWRRWLEQGVMTTHRTSPSSPPSAARGRFNG